MPQNITIWLDDERDPSDQPWIDHIWQMNDGTQTKVLWVKTVQQFKDTILDVQANPNQILYACSFDNDLGEFGPESEGHHALNWLEEQIVLNNWPFLIIFAHTANVGIRKAMHQAITKLLNHWGRSLH
jgi:hypothetical protein